MPSATDKTSVADLVCLVIDDGLFVHVASELAKGFKKVLYGLALRDVAPKSYRSMIGKGLVNVERVEDIFDAARRADLIVFPDVYTSDLAGEFKRQGKLVFGATNEVAELETDRWTTRQLIRDAGLPVVKAKRIVGIEALEAELKVGDEKWVKGLRYRGDFETFHHLDWFMSRLWLHDLEAKLGPAGSSQIFILEDPIDDAVEVGIDGAVVEGEFPETISYGYEDKDTGYIGKVVAYRDLPKPIKEVTEKFKPILKDRKYTGWYSAEIRITKTGVPYFIDPTCRCGLPPSESYMDLFSNWPDFVWSAARGQMIDLKPAAGAKFSAQLQMTADYAIEHYLAWDIPEKDKRWVKLQSHFRQNGVDYNCPRGDATVGAVTAIGESVDQVEKACLSRAAGVKAYSLDYDAATFDRLNITIDKGRKHGVEF